MKSLKKITSLQNPQVKKLLKLREQKFRKETHEFLVEGVREQGKAIFAKYNLSEIYFCPELLSEEGKDLLSELQQFDQAFLYEFSKECFEKVVVRKQTDGLLLVFKSKEQKLWTSSQEAFWLVLDRLEKPGNIGALFRIADGAGVNGVVLCDCPVDLYNPNLIRSSLGTCFSIPTLQLNAKETMFFLKKMKIHSYAAVLSDLSKDYDSINYQSPSALVLGSEAHGLGSEWKKTVEAFVSIPMSGEADSLNVASAGAVLLYEMAKIFRN